MYAITFMVFLNSLYNEFVTNKESETPPLSSKSDLIIGGLGWLT